MSKKVVSPISCLKPQKSAKALKIVIETPRGCRNKFAFDPELELFRLTAVLPAGQSFPFDFGFIPGTKGADGDPLDVMLLMDEPAFPGCIVEGRLIGVIEATQTERSGKKTIRNDRLIAIATESHLHRSIETIKDIDSRLLAEIEEFFISFNAMKGGTFKPRGRFGPARARALLKNGLKAASK